MTSDRNTRLQRIAELRAEHYPRDERAAFRRFVIEEYKADPRVSTIHRLGVSYSAWFHWKRAYETETGEELPRAAGSGRPENSTRNAEIVALVAETRSLSDAARRFGLTRERVRQIVAKHERTAGGRLERNVHGGRKPAPLVTWTCERCGRSWQTTPGKVGRCKMDCSRHGTIEIAQRIIDMRLGGARWSAILPEFGRDERYTGHLHRFAWCHLRRLGRVDLVPLIFSERVSTGYLQKKYPWPEASLSFDNLRASSADFEFW